MKVVINKCFGGFSISNLAIERYEELTGKKINAYDIERNDPVLIQLVEQMGKRSFGICADLHIIDIPDDVDWTVEEYDGNEWVSEIHRTWR